MREAIGGTWLLYFFFTFIFIYIVFITVIMNYASAYRTNNYVISQLENMEGNVNWSIIKQDIKQKYSYVNDINFCCIKNNNSGVVYRTETYVSFELPLISENIRIPIQNDSKTVHNGSCSTSDYCR